MFNLMKRIVKNFIKVSIFVTLFNVYLLNVSADVTTFKGTLSEIRGAYCVTNKSDKCILSGASCEIRILNLINQGSVHRAEIQLVVNGVESKVLTLPGRPYVGEYEYDYSSDLDRVNKGDHENYKLISDNFMFEILKSYFPDSPAELFEPTPIRLLFGVSNDQALLTGEAIGQGGGLFADGKFGHFSCKGTIIK